MRLLRGDGTVVKVGHRGAPLVARENTLAAIVAAADLGVDAVEVDVVALPDGSVVLGHSLHELAPEAPTLAETLELARELGVGLQLDVKGRGHEREIASAVVRHGLLEQTFVSSFSRTSLRVLADAEPRLRRSFTYPDDRHGLSERRLVRPLVSPALAGMRRALPARLPRWLRGVGASAATLHWTFVSSLVVRRCHALGIAVYAWTVDDADAARALDGLGIDGIITNDPGIFAGH